ncbi:MAG: class II glutamine amidotransferase, partial [Betaproteobacteria bacterium]|nr:class II glutamine amidotransferase [Betaproteobacteria bacterium]
MCGIVGAVANDNVVPVLLDGLLHLEYRGYDSAGLVVTCNGLHRLRTTGRVTELQKLANEKNAHGFAGIAHTRWATHGAPSERNAHPHFSGTPESSIRIAVVHNGIIENHEAMRQRLQAEGYEFVSDTDTEVIAHLIAFNLKNTDDLLKAVCTSISELHGAYAIAVMEEVHPERIVVARNGAPLLLGLGESGNYAASDASALLKATRDMIYLEEGDVAELTRDGYRIVNCLNGDLVKEVKRTVHKSNLSS